MALLSLVGFIGGTGRMRDGLPREPQSSSRRLPPSRGMSQFLFRGLAATLLLAAPWRTLAESAISAEYQVKAIFLSKFASFVTWPDNVFSDAKAPIVIG